MVVKVTRAPDLDQLHDQPLPVIDKPGPAIPAGLESLAAEAARLESPPLDPTLTLPPGEPPAPKLTNSQCLCMALDIIRETLCSVAKLESPRETMAAEKWAPGLEAVGGVLDKYGIDLQAAGGAYMQEITAVMLVAPLAWGAYAGVQLELKAKAKPAKAKPLTDQPAGAVPVVPDAPGTETKEPAPMVFAANDPRSISLNG